MNSHNHPMFGSIGAWFYSALAGINLDPARPGYERLRLQPGAVRDLRWASGSLETLRGTVLSSWSRTENSFRLEAAVPVGSEAEIHLPTLNLASVVVRESGRVVWKGDAYQAGAPGLRGARRAGDAVIFQAGSGRYLFELASQ